MKYFYNLLDGFKEPDRFYDEQTIRRFRVYPATPEIEKEAYENPHSDLWPVHDIHNSSTEPVDCKDIDEAYRYILESENTSVYGDSFHQTFTEEGMAMPRIRLGDKLARFKSLTKSEVQEVKDESIRDTLIDLANYAIMTVLELDDLKAEEHADER